MNPSPFLLVICDGLGHSQGTAYNAVSRATTPHLDNLWARYPHTLLAASGSAVGLPEHNPGNSEAGHLAIGAGRTIVQPVTRLLEAIKENRFGTNSILERGFAAIKKGSGRLHIMGLLSDAGVHSHQDIMYAAALAAQQQGITQIYLHLFLDGRDSPPQSATRFLEIVDRYRAQHPAVQIASITGRFYALDRDQHWDRTEPCYRMLTTQSVPSFTHWQTAIDRYYSQEIFDEFIPPTLLCTDGIIGNSDGIFFFNIRPDRARQLTHAFIESTFAPFKRPALELACFITPVPYSKDLAHLAMYQNEPIKHTLTETLLAHDKTVFEIAETEKYAHVSYFFNGGREKIMPQETRVLIQSLPLATYDRSPCMSAPQITQRVLESLAQDRHDFYVINYANADMVGHSGNFEATIKAIECIDEQIGSLYTKAIQELKGSMIITGDHGKAEEMFDIKSGQPRKAHTNNPVPFMYINQENKKCDVSELHAITDIASFTLRCYDIPVPKEMRRKPS